MDPQKLMKALEADYKSYLVDKDAYDYSGHGRDQWLISLTRADYIRDLMIRMAKGEFDKEGGD